MESKTGEYIYTNHKEVVNGCWISTHHKATLYLPAEELIKETRHISNIAVNEDIPNQIFDYELFLKNIEFTNDFKNTYE